MHMILPKPSWFIRPIPFGRAFHATRNILDRSGIRTVCRESHCPNLGECFSSGVGAFLILGNRCLRGCRYCGIERGCPEPPDPEEPRTVAHAVRTLGLRHAVITSVTRDDLSNGGAGQFAETIRAIRAAAPGTRVEVLVPDFGGLARNARILAEARPDVIAHNIDTVPRLFPSVRPNADYRRSLDLLRLLGEIAPDIPLKSGLVLGLGETGDEIRAALRDLVSVNCRRLVLGQYLPPSRESMPVRRFVTPEEFGEWRETALGLGFCRVVSGPLARSSYRAGAGEDELATEEFTAEGRG